MMICMKIAIVMSVMMIVDGDDVCRNDDGYDAVDDDADDAVVSAGVAHKDADGCDAELYGIMTCW